MFCYDALCHLESNTIPQKLLLVITTDLTAIPKLVNLRQQYPKQAKIGFAIHPWFIHNSELTGLKQLIEEYKPDFIGEIGLDYLKPQPELQRKIFSAQLNLAEEYNLPVIIHCIRAYNDVLNLIRKYNTRGIIHGFNAHAILAKEFTDLGYLIGVGSNITKNTKIAKSINNIGINNLVFESDAPFMPGFGNTYSVSNDTFLYAQIAARKLDINLIDLIEQSNNNLIKLFK
jgi:TatD DNase family protein